MNIYNLFKSLEVDNEDRRRIKYHCLLRASSESDISSTCGSHQAISDAFRILCTISYLSLIHI